MPGKEAIKPGTHAKKMSSQLIKNTFFHPKTRVEKFSSFEIFVTAFHLGSVVKIMTISAMNSGTPARIRSHVNGLFKKAYCRCRILGAAYHKSRKEKAEHTGHHSQPLVYAQIGGPYQPKEADKKHD